MKNKLGQMKIKQMAFMLIAVTIFLVMVGMFILMIRIGKLNDDASQLEKENAVLLASKLANSPEFSCGEAFGTQKSNCIDFDKAWALKNDMWKYHDFWGVSNLELKTVYGGNRAECTPTSYPNQCGSITFIDKPMSGNDASSFVTICRKAQNNEGEMYNRCNLGKLFVRYENVN